MIQSLFAGVSGMLANQDEMDVIGNNIANANTTAFKASTADFEETVPPQFPAEPQSSVVRVKTPNPS